MIITCTDQGLEFNGIWSPQIQLPTIECFGKKRGQIGDRPDNIDFIFMKEIKAKCDALPWFKPRGEYIIKGDEKDEDVCEDDDEDQVINQKNKRNWFKDTYRWIFRGINIV